MIFIEGIHSIAMAGENLVVGTGSGTVAVIKKANLAVLRYLHCLSLYFF